MPGLIENPIGMVNPLQGFVQVESLSQQQYSQSCGHRNGNGNHAAEQRLESGVLHLDQSLLSEERIKLPVSLALRAFPNAVI